MSKRTRKGEKVQKDKEEENDVQSPYVEEDVGFLPVDSRRALCSICEEEQAHARIGKQKFCCLCFLGINQNQVCYVQCDLCDRNIGSYLVDGEPSSKYITCSNCVDELYEHAKKMNTRSLKRIRQVIDELE